MKKKGYFIWRNEGT